MFQWLSGLIKSKPSEIKKVLFFGDCLETALDVMTKSNKICDYVNNNGPISGTSILLAKNPDLTFIIQNISYCKLEGVELLYFKNDEISKKLAMQFKKLFKITQVHMIGIDDNEYISLSPYIKLKRKLIIKHSGDESLSNIILKFLSKV